MNEAADRAESWWNRDRASTSNQPQLSVGELNERIDGWIRKLQKTRGYLNQKEPEEMLMPDVEPALQQIMDIMQEDDSASPATYLANLQLDQEEENTMGAYLHSLDEATDLDLFYLIGETEMEGPAKVMVEEILEEFQDIVSKGSSDIGNCTTVEYAIRFMDKTLHKC